MAFRVTVRYSDDTEETMVYRLAHIKIWINRVLGPCPRKNKVSVLPVFPWIFQMAMSDSRSDIESMIIEENVSQ